MIRTDRDQHHALARWSVVAIALVATACSTRSPSSPSTTGSTRHATVHLSDADTGRAVQLSEGDGLVVVLHSTYWTFLPVAPGGVLRAVGPARTTPVFGSCVPGQGCGTVTTEFGAVGVGTVTVEATRTTCGEARRCAPGQGEFRVQVRVRPGSA